MNIRAWAAAIPDEYYAWGSVNAIPWNMERYKPIFDKNSPTYVQGMTTPSTVHLLNTAVRHMEPNECYLEVGTWRGATLIGALLGNDVHGVAIDDDSMDDHDGDVRNSQDVWRENMATFGMTERTYYIDGSVPEVWGHKALTELLLDPTPAPVGVYFFDGDKSTENAAYEGLSGVVPFLADEALIVVDDANEITIRLAVHRFERAYPQNVVKIIDIPTPGNCWPCFWNGIMALAWKRA